MFLAAYAKIKNHRLLQICKRGPATLLRVNQEYRLEKHTLTRLTLHHLMRALEDQLLIFIPGFTGYVGHRSVGRMGPTARFRWWSEMVLRLRD